MIAVAWNVEGVGGGEAYAESLDVVPGAVQRIIEGALRQYAPGPIAVMMPRLVAPLVRTLISDIGATLADDRQWEYLADGVKITVSEERSGDVSAGQSQSA